MGGGDDVGSPVVVGALILDVHAKPSSTAPISGTTVPGQVLFTPGGVARNVAECIYKLGIRPFMIGALGIRITFFIRITF
ncbi:hypothetical protein YC2023_083833 [Brassica napus]